MQIRRLAVLLSGAGSNFQAVLDATLRGDIDAEIVGVIADRPAKGLERAQNAGIPAHLVERGAPDFHVALSATLRELAPDGIVLAGFLSILPPDVTAAYKNRIINIHPSLIPSFCGMGFYGARVHQAVLDYGCKISGVTVHFVDEGTDTGPIILQQAMEVRSDDTVTELAARVLKIEHQLLPRAVALLCAGKLRVEGRRVFIDE